MRLLMATAAALAALAALAGCSEDTSVLGTAPDDGIYGRTFLSTRVEGRELVPDTRLSLSFTDDGTLGASAGCNSLGGEADLDGSTLVVEGLSMTEIGCDEPRHDQDQWLADVLTGRPELSLDGLVLRIETDDVVIELLDQESADPDRSLIGTEWHLDTFLDADSASNVAGMEGVVITFELGGRLVGTTGCNDISGTYALDRPRVEISDLTTTDAACPDDRGDIEQRVLEVLGSGPLTFDIDADRLTLTTPADDGGLGFTADEPAEP